MLNKHCINILQASKTYKTSISFFFFCELKKLIKHRFFTSLKNLQKHGCDFFQKNARAKKLRIYFFGIYGSAQDTNCKKNCSDMHKCKMLKLPNVSRSASPIFYKRKRYTKVLFNKMFFSKKWGSVRRGHASAKRLPPFFEKKHFI